MSIRKIIFCGLAVLALLALIFFIGHRRNSSQLIRHQDWNDLNLTIYFLGGILTPLPLTESHVMNSYQESKITVPGERLQEHADLLNQLYSVNLIPVEVESRMDVRVLYLFETGDGKEVLRVSMWGSGNSMYVNGREVEEERVFYDIIIPFLPEEIVQFLPPLINSD